MGAGGHGAGQGRPTRHRAGHSAAQGAPTTTAAVAEAAARFARRRPDTATAHGRADGGTPARGFRAGQKADRPSPGRRGSKAHGARRAQRRGLPAANWARPQGLPRTNAGPRPACGDAVLAGVSYGARIPLEFGRLTQGQTTGPARPYVAVRQGRIERGPASYGREPARLAGRAPVTSCTSITLASPYLSRYIASCSFTPRAAHPGASTSIITTSMVGHPPTHHHAHAAARASAAS